MTLTGTRGAHPELVHRAWVVACDREGGLTYATPGADQLATFFRSAAKPFQAVPLLGVKPPFSGSDWLALACGSHTATPAHTERVGRWLQETFPGEPPEACAAHLACGAHWPVDTATRHAMHQAGETPSGLHHNCSGKHAGMLWVCRQQGWPTQTYTQPDHPLQQAILSALKTHSGLAEIDTALDGCGVPTFHLPLTGMARLYAALASTPSLAPIAEAMTTHPALVGGPGRVDTGIMLVSEGNLLAKVGADGVLCVANRATGEGLAVKVADGSEFARNLITVRTLLHLGWLSPVDLGDPRLSSFADLERVNTQGDVVGEWRLCFDG